MKVKDPKTDEPAVRNPFQGSRVPRETQKSGQDPNDEDSAFQDWTIQNLQARGVQFLCCHTATEEQSRALIQQYRLTMQPEELVKELLAHILPGVLVVASMAAAIAVLQCEGRYSYIAV